MTREGALECLLWCIASQALPFEIASGFVYNLRRDSNNSNGHDKLAQYTSFDVLSNKDKVNLAATLSGLRFAKAKRFDAVVDYFSSREGEWWQDVISDNGDLRAKYSDPNSPQYVKWLSRKTYSFWHICLGGKNLIALDVHVMRNLADLGMDIDPNFYTPMARINGKQKVRKTPDAKQYAKIEARAKEYFSGDKRFLQPDGSVDAALIDGVLWWAGADRGVGDFLFGSYESWTFPYGDLSKQVS